MREPLDRLLDGAQDYLRGLVNQQMREAEHVCESPIEVVFLQAMTLYNLLICGKFPAFEADQWNNVGHLIEPQKQILDYRVDFLISSPDIKTQIVVECDGHDFHERTADQAAKDRSRDRALSSHGYRVVRFTGRELWGNPWQCAMDMEAQVISAWRLEGRPRAK